MMSLIFALSMVLKQKLLNVKCLLNHNEQLIAKLLINIPIFSYTDFGLDSSNHKVIFISVHAKFVFSLSPQSDTMYTGIWLYKLWSRHVHVLGIFKLSTHVPQALLLFFQGVPVGFCLAQIWHEQTLWGIVCMYSSIFSL